MRSSAPGGIPRAGARAWDAGSLETLKLRHYRCPRPVRTAPGLAAMEAVLLFVVCAAALALLAGQGETMRTAMRNDLATRQLVMLREALHVYYLDEGAFPCSRADLAAGDAWKTLHSVPSAAKVLASWPGLTETPAASEPLDPWRQQYRYLHSPQDYSHQVTDNGDWPVFISSGPDRRFGSLSDPAGELDNRTTDELPQGAPR